MQKNQSLQSNSSFFILSFAMPHEPAGDTITSSPGTQSAGVATSYLSAVCMAANAFSNSVKIYSQ